MKPTFCWICGRRFWSNKVYYIFGESGFVKWVHKECAKKYGCDLISKEEAWHNAFIKIAEKNVFG